MPYRKHLKKDKLLAKHISKELSFTCETRSNLHLALCSSIISQQLSTKVAEVIFERFMALFKSRYPSPAQIIKVPVEKLREIGLSKAKASYVQNVCRFFIEEKLTDEKLHVMSNEELINYLSKIKGIGKWTVEMVLIFSMGRQDVFSTGDYGLKKAMCNIYGLSIENDKELIRQMLLISENWKPYRSYACRYLWRSLEAPAN